MQTKFNRVYKPIEAVPMMGIPCTKNTADRYILNMSKDGILQSSYRWKNRYWCVTDTDIEIARAKILSGEYIPRVGEIKEAA